MNIIKFVLCNLRASSLAKPLFIYLSTVRSLNVCNAVKFVKSTHHIRRVFPITHDVVSNHRQPFHPKANVFSSSRTKSSPPYLTSNSRFLPIVISPWNLQDISLPPKFCIFFMMLVTVTLLNQPIQVILVFDFLMDLFLLLLVYLQFYSSMSYRLSFYFTQHKQHLKPSFDCFLT